MADKIYTVEEQINRPREMLLSHVDKSQGKPDYLLLLMQYMIHATTIDAVIACLEELGIAKTTLDIAKKRVLVSPDDMFSGEN